MAAVDRVRAEVAALPAVSGPVGHAEARSSAASTSRTDVASACGPPGGEDVEKQAQARVRVVNQTLRQLGLSLRFRIEREEGIVRILVVERVSGEVVRTIPAEGFLNATVAATTPGFLKGLILDENA